MPLRTLDHINIRTANLPAMIAWYRDVLKLTEGPRPPFSIPGAWMYLGEAPIVHLVGVTSAPENRDPGLEHFAISATDMAGFLATLREHDVNYTIDPVPDMPMVQVNLRDCDGNHIHVDFAAEEAEGLS